MIGPIPLGPADAADLHALHAPLFNPPWSTDSLAQQLSVAGAAGLGLWENERLAGFVLMRTVLDEAEILILAVAPERQRRGVGRRLLAAAVTLAAARGAGALWLEVAVDNPPALALYRGAGFETAGRRPGYYRRPGGGAVDALLLRRTLSGVAP